MNVLRHVSFLSLALLLALSACSDSDAPTGMERPPLDEDGSIAILAELMRTSSGLTREILTGTLRQPHPAAMDTFARPLSVVRACTEGGRVALEGSVRKELTKKGTGSVILSVAQRPVDCRTQAPQEILTINGDPEVVVEGVYTLREKQATAVRWSMRGHLHYAGARSGRCDIDVRYRMDFRSASGTVEGTVCGHPVNERF